MPLWFPDKCPRDYLEQLIAGVLRCNSETKYTRLYYLLNILSFQRSACKRAARSVPKGSDGNSPGFYVFQNPGGAIRGTAEAKHKVGRGRSAESCDAAVKFTRKWIRVSAQPNLSFDFPVGHKRAKTILTSSPALLLLMLSFVFPRVKLFDGIHGHAEDHSH